MKKIAYLYSLSILLGIVGIYTTHKIIIFAGILFFTVGIFNELVLPMYCNTKVLSDKLHKSLNIKIEKFNINKSIKKINKPLNPLKNFLRPSMEFHEQKAVTLANQYCMVKFFVGQKRIIFFDKLTCEGYSINNEFLHSIFRYVCKNFDFSTRYNNLSEDLLAKFPKLVNTKKEITKHTLDTLKNISINNMSIAELICLPGINMGKANKIIKYLKKGTDFNKVNEYTKKIKKGTDFQTLEEFIEYIDISPKNQSEIRKIFNSQGFTSISTLNKIN